MGAHNAKENLYSAIEAEDVIWIKEILKANPNIVNQPMTDDCKSTPIERAAWRGSIPLLQILITLGADVNYTGVKGLSALITASRRYKQDAVDFLIDNGADINYESPEKMRAIDYAIVHGSYGIALKFMKMGQEHKTAEEYMKFNMTKKLPYFDYETMLTYLDKGVPAKECPVFHNRPPSRTQKLKDPVVDPRETWPEFIHRIVEFQDPPVVERSELPLNLQPQNRVLGRVRELFNRDLVYNESKEEELKNSEEETKSINKSKINCTITENEESKTKENGTPRFEQDIKENKI